MAEQKSAQTLPRPLHAAASVLRKVPGAGTVGRAAEGALDRIGAVSPRGRRVVVYTGAGVLGVAGLVEWPVAVTGAAVAWLTQPWRREDGDAGREGTAAGGGTPAKRGPADVARKEPGRADSAKTAATKKAAAKKAAARKATSQAASAQKAATKTATPRTAPAKTATVRTPTVKKAAASKQATATAAARKTASPTRADGRSATSASPGRSRRTASSSRMRRTG